MTTPANPADLLAFLRAIYDERERVARAATSGPWHLDGGSVVHSGPSTSASNERWGHYIAPSVGAYDGGHPTDADAAHIADNDPAYVLADLAAKRRILDEHPQGEDGFCGDDIGLVGCKWAWPCPTVRLLALPHAERDGYRSEWAPA